MKYSNKDLDLFFDRTLNFSEKKSLNEGDFIFKQNTNIPNNTLVYYWAANPANYNSSYSGSGLPYINPTIAFEKTPNLGITKVTNNKLTIQLYFPSSFYCHMGNTFINPTIFIRVGSLKSPTKTIDIKNAVPYRKCVNKKFCDSNINIINNQENILRSKAYPNKNIETF